LLTTNTGVASEGW